MEGFNQNREKEVRVPENRNQKLESAQQILAPIFKERLSSDAVLEYLMEKNKASFAGLEERGL